MIITEVVDSEGLHMSYERGDERDNEFVDGFSDRMSYM